MENYKMSLKPKKELSKEELPKVELPKGELPKGELPKPNPELPKRETPSCSLEARCPPRLGSPKCLLPEPSKKSSSERTAKVEEAPGTSTGGETGPQVYLRLRPVAKRSKSYSISEDGNVFITRKNANRMEKHFPFTTIFESSVDQRQIYDTCVGPKISEEECVTIMTYGTSGSGKTFTLLGDEGSAGIIPRAVYNIFARRRGMVYSVPRVKLINGCIAFLKPPAEQMELDIRENLLSLCPDIGQDLKLNIKKDHEFSRKSGDPEEGVMIWVSYVEVYNELAYDLLAVPKTTSKSMQEAPRKSLKVMWNKGKVFVKGLTKVFVMTSEDALRLLRLGQQRCSSAATEVNRNSSRSHCIFTVEVIKCNGSGVTSQSIFKFCDLAGSERVNSTGTTGQRLEEAKNINTSLMTLGRCLDAASKAQKKRNMDIIPYRDSKLTMLLQAALLGKEKLAMIVTVSPIDSCYEENMNVLSFASTAQEIEWKESLIKEQPSCIVGFLELPKVAPDKEDTERAMELEAKAVCLRMQLTSQRRRYEAENQQLRDQIWDLKNPKTVKKTKQKATQSGEVKLSRFKAMQSCLIS